KNLENGMPMTDSITVSIYDPVQLLSGGPPLAANTFMGGTYVFPNIPPPTLINIILVITGDADKMNTTFVNTATGEQMILMGTIYHVDAYATKRTLTNAWKTASASNPNPFDVDPSGGYLTKFYLDAKPADPKILIANETRPAPNVTVSFNSMS